MDIKTILKILTNFIKNKFYLIIVLLIFLSISHFFYNFYALSVRDYNERMLIAYNYCGGVSYGFIHKITEKYLKNEKKIYIINFELNPSSYGLFHETKIDKKFESNSSNQVFEQSPNKYILVYEKSFWENGKYRSFVILKYSISS